LVAGGSGGQLDPRAAILSDTTIVVVFQDSFGSTSDDGGVAWHARWTVSFDGVMFSKPIAFEQSPGHYDLFPSISGGGHPGQPLFVTWLREQYVTHLTEIRMAASINGGLTFSRDRRIDTPGARHQRPRVAATSTAALIVYDSFLAPDEQVVPGLVLQDS